MDDQPPTPTDPETISSLYQVDSDTPHDPAQATNPQQQIIEMDE